MMATIARLPTWTRRGIPWLLVLLLTLPAILPLLEPLLPRTHDWPFHYARSACLIAELQRGTLYPRWLPDAGLGLGLPTFNYLAPLPYYLTSGVFALTASLPLSLNLVMAASVAVSGLAMFWLARLLTGSVWPSLVAATLYVYAPYHLVNVYRRGALGEAWGMAWLPLVLAGCYLAINRGSRRGVVVLAGSFLGLLLTHNLTAFFFLPIALVFAVMLLAGQGERAQRRAAIGHLASGLGGGLLLGAFFWLPALGESGAADLSSFIRQPGFRPHEMLLNLRNVVQTSGLSFDYDVFPYRAGLVEVLILAVCAILLVVRRSLPGRLMGAGALALAVGSLLGLTDLSRWAWLAVPPSDYLQFSFRLLAFFSLGVALAACVALAGRGVWRYPAGLALGAILAVTSLGGLPIDRVSLEPDLPSPAQLARRDAGGVVDGKMPDAEFLPRWSVVGPADSAVPTADPAPTSARLILHASDATRLDVTVNTTEPVGLRLPWRYFPGWQARTNGRPVEVSPAPEDGRAMVDLPAGESRLEVWFGETPPRWIGWGISAVTVVAGLVWLIVPVRWPAPARRLALAAPASLLILALVATVAPSGGAANPATPVGTTLAPGIQLLGVSSGQISRGGLPVDLLWFAGGRPSGDTVQLRLLDAQGRDVANVVEEPNFGLAGPDFWRPPAIIQDRHEVPLPAAPPAGDYTLVVNLAGGTGDARVPLRIGQPMPTVSGIPRHPFNLEFGEAIRLAAAGIGQLPATPWAAAAVEPINNSLGVQPGDRLRIDLHWMARQQLNENLHVFVHLTTPDGRRAAQSDGQPGSQLAPTTTWRPGQSVTDRHVLRVPVDAAPGVYAVRAGMYSLGDYSRLATGTDGETAPLIGLVKVGRWPAPPPSELPATQTLGGTLVYHGHNRPKLADDALVVTSHWSAATPLEDDFTLFTHVVDSTGRLVFQHDGPPQEGRYPTRFWQPDETIAETHRLPLPPSLAAGTYRVLIGAYRSADQQRLVVDGSGATAIDLGTIELPSGAKP